MANVMLLNATGFLPGLPSRTGSGRGEEEQSWPGGVSSSEAC